MSVTDLSPGGKNIIFKFSGHKATTYTVSRRHSKFSLTSSFHQVYHLASVRLRDLFDKLGIEEDALMKKIWTCFEYGLVHHAGSLMCDRHLDQLIMCSIYLITKVKKVDIHTPITLNGI